MTARKGNSVFSAAMLVAICLALLVSGCALARPRDLSSTMVGWWLNEQDQQMVYHIDARSRVMMYSDEWGEPFLPANYGGFGDWCPVVVGEDGACKIRWGGSLGASEGYKTSAQYRIEADSANGLLWTAIEEPDYVRSSRFDGAVMVRLAVVEALFGAWQTADQPDRQLALGEDMHYWLTQGRDADRETMLTGSFRWDPENEQLRFRDSPDSACGDRDEGRYVVKVSAGKQLAFQLVTDECVARREALAEAGIFAPAATESPLTGCFVDKTSGRYELCFGAGGVVRLWDLQLEAANPCEGNFEAWGQTLRLTDQRGATKCRPEPGEYKFELDKDTLTLRAAGDTCEKRVAFYAANPAWERER